MARIRSVHPGLLTDEAFMALTVESPLAIALLIGLWMEADDTGTFEWKPLTIKARVLPAISGSVGDLLDQLARLNFVRQFDFDGKPFGVIRNFVKYQRPKSPHDVHPFSAASRAYAGFKADGKRPNAGTGRPSQGDCSEPVPNSPETTFEIEPQRKEEGEGKERSLRSLAKSESDADLAAAYRLEASRRTAAPPHRKSSRGKPKTPIVEDAQPTDRDHTAAANAGLSGEAFRVEWRKFRDHHLSKRTLFADWAAAWRTWLGNMHNFQRGPPRAGPSVRTNTYLQAAMDSQADENADQFNEHDDNERRALAYIEGEPL